MKHYWLTFGMIILIAALLFFAGCVPLTEDADNRAALGLGTGLPEIHPADLIKTPLPPAQSFGGAHWIVEIDILQSMGSAASAQDLQTQVKALMPAGVPLEIWVTDGTSPNGAVYTIHIEGDNTDVMRLIIYDLLSPLVDVSSQPMLVNLSGTVSKGSQLALLFSGIPSTGAEFLVDGLGALFNLQSSNYECAGVGPGGQNLQTIVLEALKSGTAFLQFYYQQAWEEVLQYFPVRVTIEGGALSGTYDLSDPSMLAQALPAMEAEPLSAGALPASFDWSTANNYTGAPQMSAVKNQGSCGSCWSFATVGVMEGVVKIKGLGEKDFSEQYLVSCNTDGWSCNGGWDSHQYHINKNGASANQPGAVLEADMPYTASNGTCKTISNHPDLLSSYHSVENTVESLKAALYTYGPLFTTLCADPLRNYSGGVITTSSCNQVDHAVILVGWDDSNQSWKVKNSWGAGWGESGYFRIQWNVSGIGQYSNYVVYGGEGVLPDDETPTPIPDTSTPIPDDEATATFTNTPVSQTDTPQPDDTQTPQGLTETPEPSEESTGKATATTSDSITPEYRIVDAGFYDDNEPGIFHYSGDWFVYQGPEPFKKTTHFSYTTENSISFRFQGSRFWLGFTADNDQGVMKIIVDERLVFFVNQYDTSRIWQKLWKSIDLGTGVHTVQIIHLDQRQIDFDYLVVE